MIRLHDLADLSGGRETWISPLVTLAFDPILALAWKLLPGRWASQANRLWFWTWSLTLRRKVS